MGLAEEKIRQFEAIHEDARLSAQLSTQRFTVISEGIPLLWEDLQEHIEGEVKTFSEKLPPPAQLVATRLNSNNLTVQTNIFPLVKLEIIREGRYIQADRTEHPSAFSRRTRAKYARIEFSVDRKFNPCFSDGDSQFSPGSLGDQFLEPVFDYLIKQVTL